MGLSDDDAKTLWQTIWDFAASAAEIAGHGNSGEFHDSRTYARLDEERKVKFALLVETFKSMTGNEPVPTLPVLEGQTLEESVGWDMKEPEGY